MHLRARKYDQAPRFPGQCELRFRIDGFLNALGMVVTLAFLNAFLWPLIVRLVLPLILGMGVDSGIHLVHRSRAENLGAGSLLATTTARAVFYSAITTIVSFGSLSLSSHLGMASLGKLLVIGMVLTLVCSLLVLPSLLAGRQPFGFSGDASGRETAEVGTET